MTKTGSGTSSNDSRDPRWTSSVALAYWSVVFQVARLHLSVHAAVPGVGWIGGKDHPLPGKHTALVDLHGVIANDTPASAERINAGLKEAFKDSNTAGVIVRVNSPGGSPVQAGQINNEIRRLARLAPKSPAVRRG